MNLTPGFFGSITFLVISSYLLLNPTVLIGFPFIKYTEIELGLLINKKVKFTFIIDDYSKEIEQIKKYFNENQPFLIKGINISDVAVGTGIAAKELSFIINQHFKQRFNEFVNQYRISYITKKLMRVIWIIIHFKHFQEKRVLQAQILLLLHSKK